MHAPLKEAAQGRWRGILPALGISLKLLDGKQHACPICDAGKDRFRFDDKEGRGTWYCNQCGAGDGISLVMKVKGVDFKQAAALIEPLAGVAPHQQPRKEVADDDKRRWMKTLWDGAVPITATDPAGMYLTRRLGLSRYPRVLRYHDNAPYEGADGKRSFGPAMLAKVTDKDGLPVNVHRTFLTYRGDKAEIPKPRAMMPGPVPEGASVRLQAHGEALGVAEGIETALAASRLHDLPCWSCINAGQLAKFQPPPGVKKVIEFADNDANFAGQHAAYQLANRLVVKAKLEAEVRGPDQVGADWNDVLNAEAASQAAA